MVQAKIIKIKRWIEERFKKNRNVNLGEHLEGERSKSEFLL